MSRVFALGKAIHAVGMIAIVIAAVTISCVPAAADATIITGAVKNVSGVPISGVLVRVRSEQSGLGVMVVSQEQGRYSTPNVLPGSYVVQAFGGNIQTAGPVSINVNKGHAEKTDLTLNTPLQINARPKRMTDDDIEKLMPESDQAGIKQILVQDCKECHTLQWTVSARKTKDQWQQTVERMANELLGRRQPLWFALKDDEFAGGKRKNYLIDYLAKNYGPDKPQDPHILSQWLPGPGSPSHSGRNLPSSLLTGRAAKYSALEYSLPSGAMPGGVAIDSHGIAWVSERNSGAIGRFDPLTLTYSQVLTPPGKSPKSDLNTIAIDPQDKVWVVDEGPNARILQYNPKSAEYKQYPIPDYGWPVSEAGPSRITALGFSNRDVWATRTTAHRILKLDIGTGKVTEYSIPRGSAPFGLAFGGDNMIWYTAEVGNVLVRLDPATGKLEPHEAPTLRSDLRGLASDGDGNLWAAATESSKLLKVDYRTGKVSEYTPPTEDCGPYAVDVDKKANKIWFSEALSDRITRFDPTSHMFIEFPHPDSDSYVQRIAVDQSHPGRVWWSSGSAAKFGYIDTE